MLRPMTILCMYKILVSNTCDIYGVRSAVLLISELVVERLRTVV